MRICLLVFLTLLRANLTSAQVFTDDKVKTSVIKGMVVDSVSKNPMGYVTIVVRETNQEHPVQNTLSQENGFFKITNLPKKQFQLVLSYVGYKAKIISVPVLGSATVNLPTIMLSPTHTQLNEVKVLSEKQLIQQDLDKTTYQVEADLESTYLTTFDLLQKVPFLTVDAEDNLLLNGSGSYQILINGQRSSLFSGNLNDALKSLPGSVIKKIEIISNPSARYEAAGVGGIINIITRSKSLSGYNGSVNLAVKSPQAYQGTGYVTAKAGKLGYSGRFSNSTHYNPPSKSRQFREDKVRQNHLFQTGESTSNNNAQQISSEFSLEASPLNHITASFNINKNTGQNSLIQHVDQQKANGEKTEAYQNQNKGKNTSNGTDFLLDFQHSFRSREQQRLSFSFNLNQNVSRNNLDFILNPLLHYTGRVSTTENQEAGHNFSFQADYTQPLGKQLIELGLKSSHQQNSSDYFYKNQVPETGIFVLDTSQSNYFSYQQQIYAAYASVNLKKNLWGLRSGLRLEEARLQANFRSSGTYAAVQYRNLFPNITLSRQLNKSGTINLAYSQRIQRPDLYYLNPYVDQTDPLNISYGNPDLQPATSHVFQLDYNLFVKNSSGSVGLFHDFTNKAMQAYTTLGSDSVARTTFANLGHNQHLGLSISGQVTLFKHLSLNLNTSTRYLKYTNQLEGNNFNSTGLTYNLQGGASYRVGKGWRAAGNINYNSPNVFFQGKSAAFASSSFTLNKTFLKNNKASINLAVRNPWRRDRRTLREVYGTGFYLRRETITVFRQFHLSFNYRFSKLHGRK